MLLALSTVSCGSDPTDQKLNALETAVIAVERELETVAEATLSVEKKSRVETLSADLRAAYTDVIRIDTAGMTRNQETRWDALRTRSIDAVTDVLDRIARAENEGR